jgi:hypothetical protein
MSDDTYNAYMRTLNLGGMGHMSDLEKARENYREAKKALRAVQGAQDHALQPAPSMKASKSLKSKRFFSVCLFLFVAFYNAVGVNCGICRACE